MVRREELKSKYSQYCLWGTCTDCTLIKNGRGIHEVREYGIYEYDDEEECEECEGKGRTQSTCPKCDGEGYVYEDCIDCSGSGNVPDVSSKGKYIKSRYEILKSEKLTQAPLGEESLIRILRKVATFPNRQQYITKESCRLRKILY